MTTSSRSPAELRPDGAAPLFAGAAAVLLLLVLTVLRSLPAAPLAADAAPELFSEARARAVLERLLGEGRPHPVGSADSARLRTALVAELAAIGLSPELRPGFACGGRWGSCAPVVNVVARLPGRSAGKAVLLSTHHDSVGAGPGASDAGASVAAAVEIARALLASGPLERPVTILLNDGEEAGLLGARAFVEEGGHEEVFAVVNLEARGTAGPSAMFETGPDNAAFVAAWAREAKRPVTSSTLYDLYKLLPSDTDLTVYVAAGLPGLNFAFADGLARYHTPLDDLAHLDRRTFQHHGANALEAVRALAALPDSARAGGDAAWLDAFSLAVVSWPQGWSLPMGVLALLLSLLGLGLALRRGLSRVRELPWALCGVMASLALPLLSGHAVVRALQALRDDPRPWTAHPEWATVAVVGAAVLGALLVAALFSRRAGAWAWWSCTALVLSAAGLVLAWRLPGAAPHGLVPALGVSGSLVLSCLAPRRWGTSLLLTGLAVAAWPWLAIGFALHVMVSLDLSVAATLPAAVLATILGAAAPAERGRWRPALVALAVLATGWATSSALPRYSKELPRPANLVHLENADSSEAWWLTAGNPPRELTAALAPTELSLPDRPWPGARRRVQAATAAATGAPAPSLELVAREERDFGRRLKLRLRSPRGAPVARVALPPEAGLRKARVEGRELELRPGSGWRFTVRGLPPEGVSVVLHLESAEPVFALVEDHRPGLPPEGARLLQARPPNAVPIQDGDVSIVYRLVELP